MFPRNTQRNRKKSQKPLITLNFHPRSRTFQRFFVFSLPFDQKTRSEKLLDFNAQGKKLSKVTLSKLALQFELLNKEKICLTLRLRETVSFCDSIYFLLFQFYYFV